MFNVGYQNFVDRGSVQFFLLVGLIFAIICHGHSRMLVVQSIVSSILACVVVTSYIEGSCPDCSLSGFFFLFGLLPVYFCMSVIVGLIYKIIHHAATDRIRRAVDDHESATGETLSLASKLLWKIWKIAFWIVFALVALSFINAAGSGTFSGIWDWLDVFVTTVAIIGFYSYAYRQNIGPGQFWKVFPVFFIGWDIFVNYVIRAPQKDSWVGLLIFSPMYMALFLYGFRFRRTERADVSSYDFSDKLNPSEKNI